MQSATTASTSIGIVVNFCFAPYLALQFLSLAKWRTDMNMKLMNLSSSDNFALSARGLRVQYEVDSGTREGLVSNILAEPARGPPPSNTHRRVLYLYIVE